MGAGCVGEGRSVVVLALLFWPGPPRAMSEGRRRHKYKIEHPEVRILSSILSNTSQTAPASTSAMATATH